MVFWHLVCSNPGTLLVPTVVDSCFKCLFDVCVISVWCPCTVDLTTRHWRSHGWAWCYVDVVCRCDVLSVFHLVGAICVGAWGVGSLYGDALKLCQLQAGGLGVISHGTCTIAMCLCTHTYVQYNVWQHSPIHAYTHYVNMDFQFRTYACAIYHTFICPCRYKAVVQPCCCAMYVCMKLFSEHVVWKWQDVIWPDWGACDKGGVRRAAWTVYDCFMITCQQHTYKASGHGCGRGCRITKKQGQEGCYWMNVYVGTWKLGN